MVLIIPGLTNKHGYRSNWVKGAPVPPPPTGIDGDPVLADHGRDQANELAGYLSSVEPRIQRIYSSPFYRCIETVAPSAKLMAVKICPETGVGEWFDRERATHPVPAPAEQLSPLFPGLIDESYKPITPVSKDGETVEELHQRAIECVTNLINELKNEPEIKTILLVTHAATKIALGRALLGDPNAEIRTGTCSVDKYVLSSDDKSGAPGDWTQQLNGYADFLTKGEEMHWSFGMLLQSKL